MENRRQDDILAHIIELTEQRDSERLEISLIKTIFELFRCRQVLFGKIRNETPEMHYTLIIDHNGQRTIENEEEMKKLFGELSDVFMSILDSETFIESRCGNQNITIHPVQFEKMVVGFIALYHDGNAVIDNSVISGLIKVYSNYISILVESQKDKLTGLLNRKTFDDQILKIIEYKKQIDSRQEPPGSRRFSSLKDSPSWLGIIDIDNFKNINDTFGHIYGDEVLILIARLMTRTFRSDDLLFRYGGEEFVVIIHTSDDDEAIAAFERFRIAVEAFKFPRVGRVTVSIGMVKVNTSEVPTSFVGHADQALYYAKNHGKNCLYVYERLVREGLIKKEIEYGRIEIF